MATQIKGIDVLVFQPKTEGASKRPGIIYFHGGGWVVMTASKGCTVILVITLRHLLTVSILLYARISCMVYIPHRSNILIPKHDMIDE